MGSPEPLSRNALGGGRALFLTCPLSWVCLYTYTPLSPSTHSLPETEVVGLPGSFDKHLLGACCMPDFVLGTEAQ